MRLIPVSVLELAVVNQDSNAKTAIDNSMRIAQKADQLGFTRIWFAEHHNMQGIASSATSLLIQLAASQTQNIRVGSGGIMLPNHSPLVIAEQFGTLETLYPGRIDLGLGRAPGTDQVTAQALRRNHYENALRFPQEVQELQSYFQNTDPTKKVRAFPGEGLNIPLWILGSSTDSAHLSARMGLPYAFATHFAPNQFFQAKQIYQNEFVASSQLTNPYFMACVNAIIAETDEAAQLLASSYINMVTGLVTGKARKGLLPPGAINEALQFAEVRRAVEQMTRFAFIGSESSVKQQLSNFISESGIDELMVTAHIFDIEAKLRSYEFLAKIMQAL